MFKFRKRRVSYPGYKLLVPWRCITSLLMFLNNAEGKPTIRLTSSHCHKLAYGISATKLKFTIVCHFMTLLIQIQLRLMQVHGSSQNFHIAEKSSIPIKLALQLVFFIMNYPLSRNHAINLGTITARSQRVLVSNSRPVIFQSSLLSLKRLWRKVTFICVKLIKMKKFIILSFPNHFIWHTIVISILG